MNPEILLTGQLVNGSSPQARFVRSLLLQELALTDQMRESKNNGEFFDSSELYDLQEKREYHYQRLVEAF